MDGKNEQEQRQIICDVSEVSKVSVPGTLTITYCVKIKKPNDNNLHSEVIEVKVGMKECLDVKMEIKEISSV